MRVGFFHTEQYRSWDDELLAVQVRKPVIQRIGTGEVFDFVRDHRDHRYDLDAECERALAFLVDHAVDVCVYSSSWYDLPPRFFRAARARGVRVVGIVWDTSIEPRADELALFLNCDKIVICDSVVNFTRYRAVQNAFKGSAADVGFAVGNLTDLDRFRSVDVTKRFDVSMLGSLEGDRVALSRALATHARARGYALNLAGGLTNETQSAGAPRGTADFLIDDAYVEQINASKILVVSQTQRDRAQVKGKVFEFLACGGFCLVDHHLEYTAMIPTGCVAYYRNTAHLTRQIDHFLARADARDAIADKGRRWFRQASDPNCFWSRVIECAFAREPLPNAAMLERSVHRFAVDELVAGRLWRRMRGQILVNLKPGVGRARTILARNILPRLRGPAAKIVRAVRSRRA